MTIEQSRNIKDFRRDIVVQIAELSRLLGMISSDDATVRDARDSFLKLSILISKALDIKLP